MAMHVPDITVEEAIENFKAHRDKEQFWLCDCGCGRLLFAWQYQIVTARQQFRRAKSQYLNPQAGQSAGDRCAFGCTERCLHGFGWLLTWEQRVGKTPTFLYFLHLTRVFLQEQNDPRGYKPILILALSKNEQDITDQVKKFIPGQPTDKIVLLNGDARELRMMREPMEAISKVMPEMVADYIFIGHYDSLGHAGAEPFVEEINKFDWLCCVLDQAERVQNADTNRTNAVTGLKREFCIPVTGEILSNPTIGEYLWHLLQELHAGRYIQENFQIPGTECKASKWIKETSKQEGCQTCDVYNKYSQRCGYDWSVSGIPLYRSREESPVWESLEKFLSSWNSPRHQHAIHKKLVEYGHLSRLTRQDLGFPPIKLVTLKIEPSPAQKQNYRQFLAGIRTVVKARADEMGVEIDQVAVDLNTLMLTTWLTQAISCSPHKMVERSTAMMNFRMKVRNKGGDMSLNTFSTENAKADAVAQYFDRLPAGDKVIVFSHYIGPLEEIEDRLKERKVPYSKLTGSTTDKAVDDAIGKFNQPSCRIFLSSDAGSAGIPMQGGLTGTQRMHVIFVGFPYWIPGLMNECGSRPYNMAMNNNVVHISLVGEVNYHSIDIESAARLAYKQSIANRVQDGDKARMNIYDYGTVGDFLRMLDKLEGLIK